jgi:hypothetical protein
MSKEMMKANMDESVMIKAIDRNAIHVRLTKLSVNPKDPLNIGRAEHVKCFSIATFEKLEAMRYAKSPLVWYTVGGYREMKIVHDGRLEDVPKEKAQTLAEVDEAKREKRKVDRIKNLAAARAAKAANNA